MTDSEQTDQFIPRRLSTGEPVVGYQPRDSVVTGRTMDSQAIQPATSDPRAFADDAPAPNPRSDRLRSSQTVVMDLLRQALSLLEDDGQPLEAADKVLLQCAATLTAEISERATARLGRPSSSRTTKSRAAKPKSTRRRTKAADK